MNSFIETISNSWFVLGLVKATLVALAGGAFILCVRQRDLAAKLWAALAVLLPLALFSGALPLSWKALPRVEAVKTARLEFVPLPLAAGRPAQAPATPLHEESTGLPVTGDEAGLSEAAAAPVITPRPSLSRDHLLILFWIAGGAATLLPGLLALLASRRLQRSAPPAEIVNLWREVAGKAAAPAPVRISRDVATPGIASVFFPEVLLPAAALEWEEERLLSVLRHEFHHIRRGDARLRWLGRVARSLLWFHPMAWWVQSRLVIAQERAADDAVIAAGIPAPEYAGHLLALASNARAFPGIAMARRSQVGRRIRTMLSPRPDLSPRRAGFERILTVVMSAVVVPAALIGFSGPETARAEEAAMIDDTGFRGPILDRNGVLLATSNPARMPGEIRSKPPIRWYPEGAAFAHFTGFVLPDDKGGIAVAKQTLEDSPALADGKPLKLTVDARIQRLATQALEARQLPGALMVMDPNSGDVLAMASWPSFDPNRFADEMTTAERLEVFKAPGKLLLNRASLPVAPGSFAKLLVALAAAKADKADRVIHCGPRVQVGSASLRDWKQDRDEELNLTSAMEASCNTYFIPLALELGTAAVASIGKDMEFGPRANSPWTWRPIWLSHYEPDKKPTEFDLAITAIGQGRTQLSLIDMARVMSAVASGEIRPARFTEADPASDPQALADLGIDARELAMIRQGLIDAVNGPRGVTKRAGLEGVTVAGKSATTQIGRGGHAATFTGYVPAEKPRFVVSAIFVREGPPSGQGDGVSGGTTAAPVVAELMKALLDAGY
jgi:beta-lactamase regulating signal transducer with metallopeptidase domain